MKANEMTSQEHTIAVVEPTLDGESTIAVARDAVSRGGGRATVVVLLGRQTIAAIEAFANAEDLSFPDAREIYIDRLTDTYAAQFPEGTDTIVTDRSSASRFVFEAAARADATSVVVPQRLAAQRNWKTSVTRSRVPVLITPPKAA